MFPPLSLIVNPTENFISSQDINNFISDVRKKSSKSKKSTRKSARLNKHSNPSTTQTNSQSSPPCSDNNQHPPTPQSSQLSPVCSTDDIILLEAPPTELKSSSDKKLKNDDIPLSNSQPRPQYREATTQDVMEVMRQQIGQNYGLPNQSNPSEPAPPTIESSQQAIEEQNPNVPPNDQPTPNLSKYQLRKMEEEKKLKAASSLMKHLINHIGSTASCETLYENFLASAIEHATELKMHRVPFTRPNDNDAENREGNPYEEQTTVRNNNPNATSNTSVRRVQRPLTRRAHERRLRSLYRLNMKRCYNEIVQDPPKWCTASAENISNAFTLIMSSPPPIPEDEGLPNMSEIENPQSNSETQSQPDIYDFQRNYSDLHISPEDVLFALERANKDTAVGTDGIQMIFWKRLPQIEYALAPLFNLIIRTSTIPQSWLESRLVLIPKSRDADSNDPLNYRPISITQTIYRLFMSCLNRKLRPLIQLSPAQKGFLQSDGCVEHAFTLQEILDDSRRRKSRINAVWIDIQKAFDSVPHNHIIHQLRRQRVPSNITQLISNLYDNCFSIATDKDGNTANITPNGRGVRQGCPLSPLLFNMVINPLLDDITECGIGYPLRGRKIGAQCFADDLVLLSNNDQDMDALLKKTEDFLTKTSLSVNHAKCANLKVTYPCHRRSINDSPLNTPKLFGNHIPPMTDFYKYLGVQSNLQSFKDLPPAFNDFTTKLSKISDSPLLPFQKINLLKIYVYPIIDHVMKNHILRIEDLGKIDALILKNIRKWLNLPNSSTKHIFYIPNSAGGLGLRQLTKDYAALRLAAGLNLINSTDETIQNIAKLSLQEVVNKRTTNSMDPLKYLHLDEEPCYSRDIRSLMSSMRLNRKSLKVDLCQLNDDQNQIDIDDESLNPPIFQPKNPTYKPTRVKLLRWHLQSHHLDLLKKQLDQGRSASCFSKHPSSNTWTRTGNIKISSYRFGLMGRINVLPTMTVLHRAQSTLDTQCRRCSCQVETLGHILNGCPNNKNLIIKRHNEVLQMIASKIKLSKQYELKIDRLFPSGVLIGDRRPDIQLIHHRSKTIIVADVSICYESSTSRMEEVREHKINKYNDEFALLEQAGYKIIPTALIFGSLGSHHPLNSQAYTLLHIQNEKKVKTLMKNITTSLIENSHLIWNNHVRTSRS